MSILQNYLSEQKMIKLMSIDKKETLTQYQDGAQCGADTPSHADKTSQLMAVMVDAINAQKGNVYSEQEKAKLVKAAEYHDIGKLTIPVDILDKNGRPTNDEFALIKTHTIAILHSWLDDKTLSQDEIDTIKYASQMALYHHEKVDGTGYPIGFSGDAIPDVAKMMAVVDVLEALTAKRAYKEPMPFEKAESIIRNDAGKHFDAEMVSALFDNQQMRDAARNIVCDNLVRDTQSFDEER